MVTGKTKEQEKFTSNHLHPFKFSTAQYGKQHFVCEERVFFEGNRNAVNVGCPKET